MNAFHVDSGMLLKQLSFEDLSPYVPKELREYIIREADGMLEQGLDDLPLSLYKDFLRTGNRVNYETPFFRKRIRLSTLVIAELLEGNGRFMDRIEDEIWSLLGEPGWVLPPHNRYDENGEQLPVPLTGRPVLDLFALETGGIVAMAYRLLEGRLTPALKETMVSELKRRIIDPYLSEFFWWMGDKGRIKLNNWTVWCTQNALLSAFCLPLTQDEYHAVLDRALSTICDWYSQYGDDGCCDEGAHYWHAAGLCFFDCVYIINSVASDSLLWLYSEEKMRNIASYIMSVHVADDRYLNFSDCSPKAGELGAREYLYGRAVNEDSLVRQSMLDFRHYIDVISNGGELPFEDNKYNLWYKWLKFRYSGDLMTLPVPAPPKVKPASFFPSVGMSVYRSGSTLLAVKSGSNDDSHNHNDTGSVIVYSGSHPILVDIGVETYTKKTFSSERYTLRPMQSLYHNVVNFGGVGQCAGPEYRATDVSMDESGITMELSKAYPSGTVGSYRRTIGFSGHCITFEENTKDCTDPVLSLIVMDKPEIDGNRISFGSWSIEMEGSGSVSVERMDITDARLRMAWPDRLYRVLVSFDGDLKWSIRL